MRKDTAESIIIIIVAFTLICGGYLYVQTESDTNPTFTNVESWSMQHSDKSQIGTIDTGDMVILKNKDSYNQLITYVDGYSNNYSTFGEYGNVVVYERNPSNNQNPVIHRLILYLEYVGNIDGTDTWSAPSLMEFDNNWSCIQSTGTPITDCTKLSGVLTLYNIGYGNKTISFNFANLENYKYSGYLTMGDNASTNNYFDQSTSITSGLVTYEQIKSVAWIEIPWGGVLKLVKNGNIDRIDKWVPNSIPCMAISLISIFLLFMTANSIINYYGYSKFYKLHNRNNK